MLPLRIPTRYPRDSDSPVSTYTLFRTKSGSLHSQNATPPTTNALDLPEPSDFKSYRKRERGIYIFLKTSMPVIQTRMKWRSPFSESTIGSTDSTLPRWAHCLLGNSGQFLKRGPFTMVTVAQIMIYLDCAASYTLLCVSYWLLTRAKQTNNHTSLTLWMLKAVIRSHLKWKCLITFSQTLQRICALTLEAHTA